MLPGSSSGGGTAAGSSVGTTAAGSGGGRMVGAKPLGLASSERFSSGAMFGDMVLARLSAVVAAFASAAAAARRTFWRRKMEKARVAMGPLGDACLRRKRKMPQRTMPARALTTTPMAMAAFAPVERPPLLRVARGYLRVNILVVMELTEAPGGREVILGPKRGRGAVL